MPLLPPNQTMKKAKHNHNHNQKTKPHQQHKQQPQPSTDHTSTPSQPSSSASSATTQSLYQRIQAERAALPINASRERILVALNQHNTLILTGETGSGKSSQIPQFLLAQQPSTSSHSIACTQPRRVAAISLAQRVAAECSKDGKGRVGGLVGYSVRFDECSSHETRIRYLTEGMLLREVLSDGLLRRYNVVVVDEAHERTVNTDILCFLLREIQRKRSALSSSPSSAATSAIPPLKIIIMSATLDTAAFTSYFSAPSLHISGRQHTVDILYTPTPQPDYIDATITTTLQLLTTSTAGDILAFLPGQDDIEAVVEGLEDKRRLMGGVRYVVLPLYAALPQPQQMTVFQPTANGERKVIVATNIAETSVTIPNIRYVIDSGLAKLKTYNPLLALDVMTVAAISKAEAWQRSGRAGRDQPGVAYRLYTESTFETWRDERAPEVERVDLAAVLLALKSNGVSDVLNAQLMCRLKRDAVAAALEQLLGLGALDADGGVSEMGRRMVGLPVDVMLSRALLLSTRDEWQCADEMATIVALLTVGNIFLGENSSSANVETAGKRSGRRTWQCDGGDQLLLLRVWREWQKHRKDSTWCDEWRVQRRSLDKAEQIREQLIALLQSQRLPIHSAGDDETRIRKCLFHAFHLRLARRQPNITAASKSHFKHNNTNNATHATDVYITEHDRQTVHIHPSSALAGGKGSEWLVYGRLVATRRVYMRECGVVEEDWVREMRGGEGGGVGGDEVKNGGEAKLRLNERMVEKLGGGGGEKNDGESKKRQRTSMLTTTSVNKKPKVMVAGGVKNKQKNGIFR